MTPDNTLCGCVGQLCRQLWSLTGGWWMGPGTQHRPAPATQHQHQIARYTQLFQHYTSTTNTPAPALHCYKTKLLMLKKQTHPYQPHQQQMHSTAQLLDGCIGWVWGWAEIFLFYCSRPGANLTEVMNSDPELQFSKGFFFMIQILCQNEFHIYYFDSFNPV